MLSIVLPTYNEAQNLPELIRRLKAVLAMPHELIIVDDDSPDRTWEVAQHLAHGDSSIRVLRRIGRRGLSSAVVEGFAMAYGDILVVMDSDLQHDPQLVLDLAKAIEGGATIAVASRYIAGGSVGEWVRGRRILSKTATYLAHALPPVKSTDPMSGFFAIRAAAYHPLAPHLHPTGFKILLEVLAHLPRSIVIAEVPLKFSMRLHGESKLSLFIEMQFLLQLMRIALLRLRSLLVHFQAPIFWVIALVLLFTFGWRAWHLRLLYSDATVRHSAEVALKTVTDKQGWLMSDVIIQNVQTDRVEILHQVHKRGVDPAHCFQIFYVAPNPSPCTH